jgi:hypothetical protein
MVMVAGADRGHGQHALSDAPKALECA